MGYTCGKDAAHLYALTQGVSTGSLAAQIHHGDRKTSPDRGGPEATQ